MDNIKLIVSSVIVFFIMCIFVASCSVVDSGEIGIKFHKWSANEQDYGGVEGTCKGWVFYNPITTSVFTYPTFIQRKNYEAFNVNAKDASVFAMGPDNRLPHQPRKGLRHLCQVPQGYRRP